jgi:hypothetical protein
MTTGCDTQKLVVSVRMGKKSGSEQRGLIKGAPLWDQYRAWLIERAQEMLDG